MSFLKNRGGFTLVELMVYTGIFAVASGMMFGVLSTVSRIQNREQAAVEVTQQSQFVNSIIQRTVSESSVIDIEPNTPTSNLKLRMKEAAKDPTHIYLEDGKIYRQEGGNNPVALNDSLVVFNSLSFVRSANPPGRDVVRVDYTLSYNTDNSALAITRTFRTAIARVSAITFDSDLLPAADNTYNVGAANPRWFNGFFSGNLNIGALLNVGTSASDLSGAQNGSIYYNTADHKFRGYIGGAWADLGGDSNLWTATSTDIFFNTGKVGVGTDVPTQSLEVSSAGGALVGNAKITGSFVNTNKNRGIHLGFDETSTPNFGVIAAAGTGIPITFFTHNDTAYAERVRITKDGEVSIGAGASPGEKLTVNGNVLADAYFHTSDSRLKNDINPITQAIAKVRQLTGVTFNWKNSGYESAGLLAQDLEKVLPEAVKTGADGYKSIDNAAVIGLLIEAIKEQQREIEELREMVEELVNN